jgi:3-oxoacyl-[acyl-carrier protein] reductase
MSDPVRYVVITGGTRGLGRSLALSFGRAGYSPVCLYRADRTAADRLAREFDEQGIAGSCVQCDVTGGLTALPTLNQGDALTLIHNAAPAFEPMPFHRQRWEDVQRGFDVMVQGGFRCMQDVLRPMVSIGGGLIINVLSTVVDGMPPKGFAGYAAAKYALLGLGRAVAVEYQDRRIGVVAVSPGYMDTDLTAQWHPDLRAVVSAGSPPEPTDDVARKVMAIAEDTTLPRRGENYVV